MTTEAKPRRRGCLSCLLLLSVVTAFVVWTVARPHVDAARFRSRVQPGMTLGTLAALERPGGPMIFVNQPAEAPRLGLGKGFAVVGDERVAPSALDARAAELRVDTISFVWTAVPVRPNVVVTFDQGGRVVSAR